MHIAFLTSRFLPFTTGGGETHTYHLATSLTERGHTVEILLATTDLTDAKQDYEYRGLKVTICPGNSSLHCESKFEPARSWLEKFLVSRPIDIIHVMVSGACTGLISAAVEFGIPLVITLLDFHNWCPNMLMRPDGSLCSGPKTMTDCHRCVLTPYRKLSHFRSAWLAVPPFYRNYILKVGPDRK